MSIKIGLAAEDEARDYLQTQGLTWVESNYRCKLGEIDLIMRDKDYLVFVEVRARTSTRHGNALESVTRFKQKKLIRTALLYLQTKRLLDKQLCRFDVVSIEGQPAQMTWLNNAFSAEGR